MSLIATRRAGDLCALLCKQSLDRQDRLARSGIVDELGSTRASACGKAAWNCGATNAAGNAANHPEHTAAEALSMTIKLC